MARDFGLPADAVLDAVVAVVLVHHEPVVEDGPVLGVADRSKGAPQLEREAALPLPGVLPHICSGFRRRWMWRLTCSSRTGSRPWVIRAVLAHEVLLDVLDLVRELLHVHAVAPAVPADDGLDVLARVAETIST